MFARRRKNRDATVTGRCRPMRCDAMRYRHDGPFEATSLGAERKPKGKREKEAILLLILASMVHLLEALLKFCDAEKPTTQG
ncbi:hypothetical protein CAJAP_02971 [Camponotus japonicus]